MRAIQIFFHEVVPDGLLPSIAKHGDRVRVVRRDRDLAVVARRMRLHEIVGQALEVRRSHADRADILADVLVELLADRGDLVPQGLYAGPRRVVAVDAREVEVSEDLGHREAGGVRFAGHIERRDGVVHVAVQAQFRGEPVRFLVRVVSGLTHRGVRMHIEEELRLREEFLEPTGQLVERLERVLDRPSTRDRHDLPEEGPAFPQVCLKLSRELRRRLREQQFRRGQSTRSAS